MRKAKELSKSKMKGDIKDQDGDDVKKRDKI